MRLFSRRLNLTVRQMAHEDIDEVREIGRKAWSDLYSREFQQNLEVPKRTRKNIIFYMDKEPEGCMVAESNGKIVGDVFCHIWGKVGWFGPVEVLPTHQNSGIGKSLISSAREFLEHRGCTVTGLETMPETVKNMSLYSNMGSFPDRITYLLEKGLVERWRNTVGTPQGLQVVRYRDMPETDALSSVRRLSSTVMPGLDYSDEVRFSMKHDTGDVLFLKKDGDIIGFSLVYTYSTSEGSNNSSIRLMAVAPEHSNRVEGEYLVRMSEEAALEAGRDRMHVRFYTGNYGAFGLLKSCGYTLKGTNVRMLFSGRIPEDGRVYHLSSWAG